MLGSGGPDEVRTALQVPAQDLKGSDVCLLGLQGEGVLWETEGTVTKGASAPGSSYALAGFFRPFLALFGQGNGLC